MNVSVVMPIHNSESFLSDAIDSVLSQSLKDWELILVDDCSTDNSLSIAREYASSDSRVNLISLTKNSGPAIARNTAIEASRGRYIAFLDSDDLWCSEKLKVQISFMEDKNVAFSYTSYQIISESGNAVGAVGVPEKINYERLLKCCVIGCLTAIYDSHKLGKVYMPIIDKRQDFGLWLDLLKRTEYAYGIHQPLAKYRVHSGSISSNKARAARYTWKLYREVEKLSFVTSSYYFFHYAVRGLLRKKSPRLAKFLGLLD